MSESLVAWNHPLPGDPFLPLGPLHFTSLLSGILCLMGCPVASLPSLTVTVYSQPDDLYFKTEAATRVCPALPTFPETTLQEIPLSEMGRLEPGPT